MIMTGKGYVNSALATAVGDDGAAHVLNGIEWCMSNVTGSLQMKRHALRLESRRINMWLAS